MWSGDRWGGGGGGEGGGGGRGEGGGVGGEGAEGLTQEDTSGLGPDWLSFQRGRLGGWRGGCSVAPREHCLYQLYCLYSAIASLTGIVTIPSLGLQSLPIDPTSSVKNNKNI